MKKRCQHLEELTEEMIAFSPDVVEEKDGSAPVLRNVLLLGPESRDRSGKVRRRYQKAVLESAVRLFDGARVYFDHAKASDLAGVRSVRELAGFVARSHLAADGVRGDIELAEGVEGTKTVLWFARKHPSAIGFSPHLRQIGVRRREGVDMIESLGAVASADIVTEPATTHGLFESQTEEGESMEWKELTLPELRTERPDLVEAIQGEGVAATENQKLKAQIVELKADSEKRAKETRESLVESLVADLPAALHPAIKDMAENVAPDELKAHVATIKESMAGNGKPPKSTEKTKDEGDGARGVADEKEILEATGLR